MPAVRPAMRWEIGHQGNRRRRPGRTGELVCAAYHGDSAELLPADDLRGLGTYATSDRLQERFGADCTVISIGQAGEYLMRGAGICCHRRARSAQQPCRPRRSRRGDGQQGTEGGCHRQAGGQIACHLQMPSCSAPPPRTFAQKLINDPKLGTKGSQHLYGTASIVAAVNEIGSLPTRNFSSGNFEGMQNLRGEHLREVILARGGKVGTRCMPGCVIACRNSYVDEARTADRRHPAV